MNAETSPSQQNNGEESNPLLSPTSAISTSPYHHSDTILRSNFLAEKHRVNRQLEHHAHQISSSSNCNALFLFFWDTFSAISIYITMLITFESAVGCLLTIGATLVCWFVVPNDGDGNSGSTGSLDWNGQLPTVLLSFAVITPLSQSISMAFQRREMALKALATYRSSVYNLYLSHSSWDWSLSSKAKGRRDCVENEADEVAIYGNRESSSPATSADEKQKKNIDWLNHGDTLLYHLINLSDSLYQYLTLPTATRARHRATPKGRQEANEILSAGREIFTLNVYGRMVMISQLCEALKFRGLPGNEASRIRQWENFVTGATEDLRIVKEYRTLQALRVFGRLFSLFLPPFYAPSYVQVAHDTGSLPLGIAMGVITSMALTGLFECVRQLEDPFVSHTTLDGIDVREELVVLAYQELMVARKMVFPEAGEFMLNRGGLETGVNEDVPGAMENEVDNRKSRHHSER